MSSWARGKSEVAPNLGHTTSLTSLQHVSNSTASVRNTSNAKKQHKNSGGRGENAHNNDGSASSLLESSLTASFQGHPPQRPYRYGTSSWWIHHSRFHRNFHNDNHDVPSCQFCLTASQPKMQCKELPPQIRGNLVNRRKESSSRPPTPKCDSGLTLC